MPAQYVDLENGQIFALSFQGPNCQTVSVKIGRPLSLVNNFLLFKDSFGTKNNKALTGKFSSTQPIYETQIKMWKKNCLQFRQPL